MYLDLNTRMGFEGSSHSGTYCTANKANVELLEDARQHDFGLNLGECRADAVARATAKWHEGIGYSILSAFWREAVGIKCFWMRPVGLISMSKIDRIQDTCSGWDAKIAEVNISGRSP